MEGILPRRKTRLYWKNHQSEEESFARTLNSVNTLPKPSLRLEAKGQTVIAGQVSSNSMVYIRIPSGVKQKEIAKKQVWQSTVKVFEAAMKEPQERARASADHEADPMGMQRKWALQKHYSWK